MIDLGLGLGGRFPKLLAFTTEPTTKEKRKEGYASLKDISSMTFCYPFRYFCTSIQGVSFTLFFFWRRRDRGLYLMHALLYYFPTCSSADLVSYILTSHPLPLLLYPPSNAVSRTTCHIRIFYSRPCLAPTSHHHDLSSLTMLTYVKLCDTLHPTRVEMIAPRVQEDTCSDRFISFICTLVHFPLGASWL